MDAQSSAIPKLSVGIIDWGIGDSLELSLSSVAHIADEIVVLDCGPSYGCRQLCDRYQTKLIEYIWDDSKSAARNNCLEQLSGEWILWIDAGEQFSPDEARQLRQHIDDKASRSEAYMLLVKVPQQAGTIAGEQIGQVRLVPNIAGIAFEGKVREQLMSSLEEQRIQVEALPLTLHRSVSEHAPENRIRRAKRDRRLVELELKETGTRPELLTILGESLQDLEEPARACECFRQAIDISERGSSGMLEAYYGLLTAMDGRVPRTEQLTLCIEALEIYPLDAQLLCAMGGYLQSQQRWDLATRSYQTAYQYGRINPTVWHLDDMRAIVCCSYSMALELEQLNDAAERVLLEGLIEDPSSIRLRRQLTELYIKRSEREPALDQIQHLPARFDQNQWRNLVLGACYAAEQNWQSADGYLEQAYASGCRDTLCFRWYTMTLMSLAETERLRPVLADWREDDPTNLEMLRYLEAIEDQRDTSRPDPPSVRLDPAGPTILPTSAFGNTTAPQQSQ